jgi:rubrerythrin
MLSVHSAVVRLAAPFMTRDRARAARMLARFAKAELGSAYTMRWAAAQTDSLERRVLYLRHAIDEERHAWMFSHRARQLGAAPAPLRADAEDLFRALGETHFLAFVHRGERRAQREFETYHAHFTAAGDRRTAAIIRAVLADEATHADYSGALLDELADNRSAALGYVTLWEAYRDARRGARALFGAIYVALMMLLYFTLLPLAGLVRLRDASRKRRASSTAAGGAPNRAKH